MSGSIKKGDFIAYKTGSNVYLVQSIDHKNGEIILLSKKGQVFEDKISQNIIKIDIKGFKEFPDDPETLRKLLLGSDYLEIQSFQDEVWKRIHNIPHIHISNFGRAKSIENKHGEELIDLISDDSGHLFLDLDVADLFYHNYKTSYPSIAYLVSKMFVKNPKKFEHFKHKDGNPIHNHFTNLEWVKKDVKIFIPVFKVKAFDPRLLYEVQFSNNVSDFYKNYKYPNELQTINQTELKETSDSTSPTSKGYYIQFNSQKWMLNNLDISKFRNGDEIKEVHSDSDWIECGKNGKPAWCYSANDSRNGEMYGKLYNWHAVNDPRGLAPEGYHVPTINEWKLLQYYLISKGFGFDSYGYRIAKSISSNSGWTESEMPGTVGYDQLSNNKSGFNALPGGHRSGYGPFYYISKGCRWWTISQRNDQYAYSCHINSWSEYIIIDSKIKGFGCFVRCIKD